MDETRWLAELDRQIDWPDQRTPWWRVRVPRTIAVALWSVALLWGVVIGLYLI